MHSSSTYANTHPHPQMHTRTGIDHMKVLLAWEFGGRLKKKIITKHFLLLCVPCS